MDEEKIKMDDGVDISSFASEDFFFFFFDLWEAQPCLWDPE